MFSLDNFKIVFFKLFILISFLLIIGPKINTEIGFLFTLVFLIIIKFKNLKYYKYSKKIFIIVFLLLIIKNVIPKFYIYESHNLLLQNKQIELLNGKISENYKQYLISNLNKYYTFYDEISKDLIGEDRKISDFYNRIDNLKLFSFSLDGQLADTANYSRKVSNINFKDLSSARIGEINHKKYSIIKILNFDKELLPFFTQFEFSEIYNKSSLCWKGSLFITYQNSQNEIITFSDNNCKKFEKFPKSILITKFIENVELKLKKNYFLKIIDFSFIIISILFLFTLLFFLKTNKFNLSSYVFLLSTISILLYIFIFDYTYLSFLNISRSGGDGLVLRSFGRDISFYLSEFNFIEVFRAGEDIYNFTPGIRYFFALQSIIFGEYMYGYILIALFLPLIIFKILKFFIHEKVAFIFIMSFLFFPIFERYGFGYFNYIRELVRSHSEVLGIFLFLTGYLIYLRDHNNKLSIYFSGFLFALSGIVRPDYILAIAILWLYISFNLLNKRLILFFTFNIGVLIILILPLHNFYFGNEFVLTTKAQSIALKIHPFEYFNFVKNYFYNETDLILKNKIINQLLGWNNYSDFHRFLVFLLVFISFFSKIKPNTRVLILAAMSQQSLLFFYHSGGRQSYFAWLLIFLSLILIFHEKQYYNYIFKRIPLWLKKKLI